MAALRVVVERQPPEVVERRIELALRMLELGAWVFPLAHGSKLPLIPKAKGGHGFLDASPDPDRARTFLSNPGQPNYGVVFPEGSDVIVLDLDGGSEDRPGWREDWQRLYELHGPPGLSFIVKTPSDGRHAYYRWRIDRYGPIPPGDEMLGWTVRKPWKGYLVGPGSVVAGRPYELVGIEHILDLPEAWAHAALGTDHGDTIRVGGQRDPADVQVGGRHAYLRDTARRYAGTVRDPDALFAAVWAANEKLAEPKTADEVRRAIGDVLARYPADPVEEDPETGVIQVVRSDGEPPMMSPADDESLFPPAPGPAAYDGLLGECTDFLLEGTDASPVAILASLVSFCGALMPAWGYWHGRHTSSPFLALVGKSGIGRKGTAMFRVRDALGYTLGMDTVNRIRFDGIASGEALVKALLDRSQQTFGVPTGVLFEEEYATFLAASGREGSNLDARMRSAFDGKQLAHRKVGETIFVPEPYYLSGLVAITPEELQAKVARASFKNGSGNRWLWLPVVRRDVRVVSTEPIFPVEIGEALLEAHRATFQTPVRIDPGAGVDDLLGEYDEFLRAESVGLRRRHDPPLRRHRLPHRHRPRVRRAVGRRDPRPHPAGHRADRVRARRAGLHLRRRLGRRERHAPAADAARGRGRDAAPVDHQQVLHPRPHQAPGRHRRPLPARRGRGRQDQDEGPDGLAAPSRAPEAGLPRLLRTNRGIQQNS